MAWPTSNAEPGPGPWLPERTTLTDLRSRPVTELPGVGPRIEAALRDLGVASLAHMVSHYPSRHEDLSNVKSISDLRVGERATVVGRVVSTRPVGKPVRGRAPGFSVQLYDGTGYLPATVWGRNWLLNQLLPDTRVVASGEVQRRYGIQLVARSIEIIDEPDGDHGPHAGRFVPVYPVNKGIQARRMRTLIHRALTAAGRILDPLPAELLARQGLPNLHDAVHEVHFPTDRPQLRAAMRRLVFHELFLIQTGLAARKARLERSEVGARHAGDGSLLNPYLRGLPFGLTAAQERVIEEVLADMRSERPMRRLLQGDVGSGKTVVAVAALLTAVESGGQGAIMAPTEVLAEQHFLSVSNALSELPVGVVLLTGSQSPAERRATLEAIKEGAAHIVIGTHALIQRGVEFKDLSLVVVDEQHRFGVSQRTLFKEKGRARPDTLVMTATPIPRTLSLTLYGDLEVSIIDELPPGRQPVETRIVDLAERREAYDEVRKELDAGRQAFVICPLVEESEALEDVRAAEELYEELAGEIFPEMRVSLLHGRMRAQEKREVMAAFRSGETNVLVATVVVEVGVDVPNATAIVVEGSERFGLSQLHQLRGRVCRGLHPPKCFLVADPRTEDAARRLEALSKYQDGFKLSEVDLAIRGEGTLFGSRQSGMPDLKVAKLLRDIDVLVEARREAFSLVSEDPTLKSPAHRPLRREIRELLGADVEWLFKE
jgi:ATP-dependent DNA helicase RecG